MSTAAYTHPEYRRQYREWIARLRSFCGEREVGFKTTQAAADYLNSINYHTARGTKITPAIVNLWIKTRGFPGSIGAQKSGTFSTNFLILAWLATERSFVIHLRRVQLGKEVRLQPPPIEPPNV